MKQAYKEVYKQLDKTKPKTAEEIHDELQNRDIKILGLRKILDSFVASGKAKSNNSSIEKKYTAR